MSDVYVSLIFQGFIDNPDREWSIDELPAITCGYSVNDIKQRVLTLDKVCKAEF